MTILEDNLHDIYKPIIGVKTCIRCNVELIVGGNWYESYEKKRVYKCNNCAIEYNKKYNKRHRTTSKRQSKGNGQYRNPFHVLGTRTNEANQSAKQVRNQNQTKYGHGKYNSPWQVIRKRTSDMNSMAKKYGMPKLTTQQTAALLIAQNYKCVITCVDLWDDYVRMSPDHIKPFVDNDGSNDISNIIWMHTSINHGKNGDTIEYIIDLTLRVGLPSDDDEYKREQRKDEIQIAINKAHELYPKVYDKIKNLTSKKLALLFNSKINAIDLLNT